MPTLYTIALFLHIVGAMSLFVTFVLEWASLRGLQRSLSAEAAQGWTNLLGVLPRTYFPIWLAIFIPGAYMTTTTWGWGTGWILVALAALLVFPILGAAVSGPRLGAIGQAVQQQGGPAPMALQHLLSDPVLWASLRIRAATLLGIIFVMTTKLSWSGALIAIITAIALGLVSSIPTLSRSRERQRSA